MDVLVGTILLFVFILIGLRVIAGLSPFGFTKPIGKAIKKTVRNLHTTTRQGTHRTMRRIVNPCTPWYAWLLLVPIGCVLFVAWILLSIIVAFLP